MNAKIQNGWLSAQKRDERRQYESERRKLACQHQRDSLRSLTRRERDRRRTARHRGLHNASPYICHVNLQLPRALREVCPAHAYT